MYGFISALIMLAALLLIFIVMIQNSKGGGLAAGFSSSNQIMGVRKTTDFLEKATWSLAGFMIVACIVITTFIPRNTVTDQSQVRQQVEDATLFDNSTVIPDFGNPQSALPEEDTEN